MKNTRFFVNLTPDFLLLQNQAKIITTNEQRILIQSHAALGKIPPIIDLSGAKA